MSWNWVRLSYLVVPSHRRAVTRLVSWEHCQGVVREIAQEGEKKACLCYRSIGAAKECVIVVNLLVGGVGSKHFGTNRTRTCHAISDEGRGRQLKLSTLGTHELLIADQWYLRTSSSRRSKYSSRSAAGAPLENFGLQRRWIFFSTWRLDASSIGNDSEKLQSGAG